MTLDQTMYLVISARKDGPIIYEVELSQMGLSTVAKDLRSGQYGTAIAVLELDPRNKICRDVTNDFDPLLK